ncbi:MAG TPA: GFA family protein [Opitutaceae bacterium]|nr:GFA family protein [Opitutaceae bacterium]
MSIIITGGCSCGAVRYEATAAPLVMLKCHCRDCQRVTGGPYVPAVVFPYPAFRITRGAVQHHTTEGVRGPNLRGFCAQCGSRLTGAENPERGIIGVVASSLDDPSLFKPTIEIWTADAQPWDHLEPTTQKFPQHLAM